MLLGGMGAHPGTFLQQPKAGMGVLDSPLGAALVSRLSFGSQSPRQALRSGSALAAQHRSALALLLQQTPPDLGWCLGLGKESYR